MEDVSDSEECDWELGDASQTTWEDKAKTLEVTCKQLQAKIKTLQRDLQQKTDEYNRLSSANDESIQNVVRLDRKLLAKDLELEKFKKAMAVSNFPFQSEMDSDNNDKIKQLTSQLERKNAYAKGVEELNSQLATEKEGLEKQLQLRQDVIDSLNGKISKMFSQEEIDRKDQKISELEGRLGLFEMFHEPQEEVENRCKMQLDEKDKQIDRLETSINLLNADKNNLLVAKAALAKENKSLAENLAEAHSEIAAHRNVVTEKVIQIEELNDKMAKMLTIHSDRIKQEELDESKAIRQIKDKLEESTAKFTAIISEQNEVLSDFRVQLNRLTFQKQELSKRAESDAEVILNLKSDMKMVEGVVDKLQKLLDIDCPQATTCFQVLLCIGSYLTSHFNVIHQVYQEIDKLSLDPHGRSNTLQVDSDSRAASTSSPGRDQERTIRRQEPSRHSEPSPKRDKPSRANDGELDDKPIDLES